MPAPLPPSADERAVVDVYRRAERALLEQVAEQAGRVARDSSGRYATVPAAVQAVRDAARGVVRQLDVITPGLFADRLTAVTEQGARDAADVLHELPGRPGADVNVAALDRVVVALLERTDEVHRSILRTTPDRFRDALLEALPAGLVGVDTRREVTQRAVWRLADQGVTTFVDRAGRTWRASTYMEMAARTALQRVQEDAKLDRLRAAGHDLVVVQGGRDRCPRCRPWNGRVLSITGAHQGAVTVTSRFGEQVTVDVAATVAEARAAGFGHPNCRCGLDLYQPGITTLPDPVERTDNGQYRARQQQRAIERDIRRLREREAASLDVPARKQAGRDVRAAQARMRRHLDENPDLLRRSYREQIGAGNLASDEQADRFRDQDAAGLPDGPRAPLVSELRVAELRDRMRSAEARGDLDAHDRYKRERSRRDAALTRRRRARIDRTRANAPASETVNVPRETSAQRAITAPTPLTDAEIRDVTQGWSAQVGDLTRAEQDAVDAYRSVTGFMYLNAILRGRELRMPDHIREQYTEHLRVLDGLARRYRTPRDLSVVRQVDSGWLPDNPGPGQVFEPAGLTSTTLLADGVSSFARSSTHVRIVVPGGTPAIVIAGREEEVVLPHGARYRYDGEYADDDGKRWALVTVVTA